MILISYIIIKLLIKRGTITAETGNGTPPLLVYKHDFLVLYRWHWELTYFKSLMDW